MLSGGPGAVDRERDLQCLGVGWERDRGCGTGVKGPVFNSIQN